MKKAILFLIFLVPAPVASGEYDAARAALRKLAPGLTIDDIRHSPVAGVLEVLSGGNILYITENGEYLFNGALVDTASGKNLTEKRRASVRKQHLAALPKNDFIVFLASNEKYRVDVFTDVDCAFCRKMHKQISAYNQLGISVYYLAFPRSGLNTPSYTKAVAVWCSENRREALTEAKLGQPLPARNCDNPVASEYRLGVSMGIRGTPTLIAPDGTLLPGYLPPVQLLQRLATLN